MIDVWNSELGLILIPYIKLGWILGTNFIHLNKTLRWFFMFHCAIHCALNSFLIMTVIRFFSKSEAVQPSTMFKVSSLVYSHLCLVCQAGNLVFQARLPNILTQTVIINNGVLPGKRKIRLFVLICLFAIILYTSGTAICLYMIMGGPFDFPFKYLLTPGHWFEGIWCFSIVLASSSVITALCSILIFCFILCSYSNNFHSTISEIRDSATAQKWYDRYKLFSDLVEFIDNTISWFNFFICSHLFLLLVINLLFCARSLDQISLSLLIMTVLWTLGGGTVLVCITIPQVAINEKVRARDI